MALSPLPLLLLLITLTPLLLLLLQRKHLLISLLILEIIILTLTPLFALSTALWADAFFIPFLLSLGACEASLGLALLVSLMRLHGSDLTRTLTANKS